MYEIIRSNRKTVAIQINGNGEVIVRAPLRMPKAEIMKFVDSKADWIARHQEAVRNRHQITGDVFSEAELRQLAAAAKEDMPRRVAKFAPLIGVTYGRITIRAQKTRWGSCSGKGNLNFNCLLMLCPEDVRDYVVVHELCHLKEMNHSARFWAEVKKILPDYAAKKKWLEVNGREFIGRLP